MKNILALVVPLTLTGCYDTGGGEKVGSIVKVAQQGVFCKTWEGQIMRGGLQNGSGATGAAFEFTIEGNEDLVKKVQHYMDTQQEVKLKYRTEFATWCRSDSESHFLVDVTPLGAVADRPLKVDTSKALPVTQSTPEQVEASTVATRDQKMMKLLQVQQEMLKELMNN